MKVFSLPMDEVHKARAQSLFHRRCARAFLLVLACLMPLSAFADQAVTVYKPNSNGSTRQGCEQVIFIMQGVFSGTIGNAAFSTAASTQTVIPISAVGDNKSLSAIPYTLAGAGSLIIVEVR